jgi:purine-binding chemotaxis protein CheW
MNRALKNRIGEEVKFGATGFALVFTVEEQRYALPLEAVEHVTRAVAITKVPDSPANVLGVVNVHGAVLPVIDLRCRLGLPKRKVALTDRLIVTRVSWGRLVLIVDEVEDLYEMTPAEMVAKQPAVSESGAVEGVMTLQDDIVLICSLERFLSDAGMEWAAGITGGCVG